MKTKLLAIFTILGIFGFAMAGAVPASAEYFIKKDSNADKTPLFVPYTKKDKEPADETGREEKNTSSAKKHESQDTGEVDAADTAETYDENAPIGPPCTDEDKKMVDHIDEGLKEVDRTVPNFNKRAKEMLEFLHNRENIKLMSSLYARCSEYKLAKHEASKEFDKDAETQE